MVLLLQTDLPRFLSFLSALDLEGPAPISYFPGCSCVLGCQITCGLSLCSNLLGGSLAPCPVVLGCLPILSLLVTKKIKKESENMCGKGGQQTSPLNLSLFGPIYSYKQLNIFGS